MRQEPLGPLADLRLFCPKCGEPTTIKVIEPLMFALDVHEITHACDVCGSETKVTVKSLSCFAVT
jgi:rRNA maturation protein Nop10